jgi:hypothetical protein
MNRAADLGRSHHENETVISATCDGTDRFVVGAVLFLPPRDVSPKNTSRIRLRVLGSRRCHVISCFAARGALALAPVLRFSRRIASLHCERWSDRAELRSFAHKGQQQSIAVPSPIMANPVGRVCSRLDRRNTWSQTENKEDTMRTTGTTGIVRIRAERVF